MTEVVNIAVASPPADIGLVRRLDAAKVGAVPLPPYGAIAAVIIGAALAQKLPADMIGRFGDKRPQYFRRRFAHARRGRRRSLSLIAAATGQRAPSLLSGDVR